MNRRPPEKSTFRFSLASYVDGIREGWRRMRGEAVRRVTDLKSGTQEHREYARKTTANDASKPETSIRRIRARGSQTSFEKFLHSLPKVDAIDRTVDWVLAQPTKIEEREPDRFANLPAPDFLLPRVTSAASESSSAKHNIMEEEESLSRYESLRGTVGRGTPPVTRDGQPRLDLLIQQTYKRQERRARQQLNQRRQHNYRSSMQSAQIPGYGTGKTTDLIPFQDRDPIHGPQQQKKHQYPLTTGEDVLVCEWGECGVAATSMGHLMTHVADHIHSRRAVGQLWCHWRGCQQAGRMWKNRQSLLHHISKFHCKSNEETQDDADQGGNTSHMLTRGVDGRNGSRANTTKPQMTMVTGLQIRPALVTKKEKRMK